MVDRIVRVLDQGKLVVHGGGKFGQGVLLTGSQRDVEPWTVDWSKWLGSDTISSVENESSGPSISGASNTTTQTLLTIALDMVGIVRQRVTTAAGAVHELRFHVRGAGSLWNINYG